VKETKNLTEVLKVDFVALAKHAFPKAKAELLAEIRGLAKLGILKRMDETAGLREAPSSDPSRTSPRSASRF